MRIGLREALTVCAAAGFVLQASGQIPASGIGTGQRASQPYTAQFKITSERTLANGTTITHESTELVAVDAEGRRLNVTTTLATGETPERAMYHFNDPVARTNATWSVPGKRVTVTKMPPAPEPGQARTGCWSTSTGVQSTITSVAGSAERSDENSGMVLGVTAGGVGISSTPLAPQVRTANQEINREDLGTKIIQGVVARGTRVTRTTPVGAIGNDAPIVHTSETWLSHSPMLTVREVTDDPETGKRSKELVEFSRGAPDSASFQFPEDYEVRTVEMHPLACQN